MRDLIPTVEAARRKGCTRQAIVNAIERGDLTGQKVGKVWLVEDDAQLAAWEVRETGGRMHRRRGTTGTSTEA